MDIKTKSKILGLMEESERKAWAALGGYKFWMAGYHMAAWVKYNQLLEEPLSNPFKRLVQFAQAVVKE